VSLSEGTKLGPYEITGQIGAGGMGEVYRATDSALKREVAIKVLPESLAQDAERLGRFRREAELLATFNHPNIAQIYGLESSGEQLALVMELIEGPTLAERIAAGPIPAEEAFEIAGQIADALTTAHSQGIVHRDLKPANIKLSDDDRVKVLDFGIAKAFDVRADTMGPRTPSLTRTSMTRAGLVLGTAAYMSPEQARGKRVDQRTDIWAYGCILYEMLTGQPAFAGEDDTSTLAKVLERDTDMSGLPAPITPHVRQALMLCLRKNPADRVADIRDVQLALRGQFQPAASAASAGRRRGAIAAGLALAAILGGGAAWLLKPGGASEPAAGAPIVRASIDVADSQHLVGRPFDGLETGVGYQRPSRPTMAYSPDGRYIVYAAGDGESSRLYRHALDQGRAVGLAGTEGASMPFFSPDGRSVGFSADGEIKRIDIESGEVRTIAIAGPDLINEGGTTASWTSDDTIVFLGPEGTYEVPATGGAPTQLTVVRRDAGEVLHAFATMLPGRSAVLYMASTQSPVPSEWNVMLQPLDGGEPRLLVEGGTDPRYVPTGHLVFARSGQLLAMPFDPVTLEAGATQAVVIEDVMYAERGGNSGLNTGTAQAAISASGALAYVPGGLFDEQTGSLVWVDRVGASTEIDVPPARFLFPRVSPDGRLLTYSTGAFGDNRLWVYDLELEVPTALATGGQGVLGVWSPDSSELAFARPDLDDAIYTMPVDRSSAPVPVGPDVRGDPVAWLPDDVLAFLHTPGPDQPRTVWTVSLEGNADPEPFLDMALGYPTFSADGRWLAYETNVTGRAEVYVRPFPAGAPETRISTAGGQSPVWSADGSKLYYRSVDPATMERTVMEVDITTEPAFTRSRPRELFRADYGGTVPIRSWDLTPDDERFVMLGDREELEPEPVERIEIVLNWFEELKRLVPVD
jgi:Tol biopolymer transport system component